MRITTCRRHIPARLCLSDPHPQPTSKSPLFFVFLPFFVCSHCLWEKVTHQQKGHPSDSTLPKNSTPLPLFPFHTHTRTHTQRESSTLDTSLSSPVLRTRVLLPVVRLPLPSPSLRQRKPTAKTTGPRPAHLPPLFTCTFSVCSVTVAHAYLPHFVFSFWCTHASEVSRRTQHCSPLRPSPLSS